MRAVSNLENVLGIRIETRNFKMANLENIVANPGLQHIRDCIFGYLCPEALEICREVSEDCNSWLRRFCVVKLMLDFVDEKRSILNLCTSSPALLVKTLVPGWKKGVTKFAQKASLDDLLDWKLEVKEFLSSYDNNAKPYWLWENPVEFAVRYDKPQMMQLFLYTDSVEVVKMMINSSNKFGIDLTARDKYGKSALDILKNKIRLEGPKNPKKREFYNELKTLLLDRLMDQF